jgi:hypothetical protein
MVSVRFSIELLQIFYNAVTKDFGRQYPCLLELKAGGFNQPGNIVIADQFNNRVIEIDPATHKIPWQFGNGSSTPGPHSIVGTNDAERVGELTLISGTGIPPASPPLPGCPDPVNGCPDNRVLLVDQEGRIIWQYGQAGVTGAGDNQLNRLTSIIRWLP